MCTWFPWTQLRQRCVHITDTVIKAERTKKKSLWWVTLGVGLFAVRMSSNGCRYRNGGCEHFCREFPDRSYMCFCAPGYRLDQDNSTCLPQGKHNEGKWATEQSDHCWKVTGKKRANTNQLCRCPSKLKQTAAYLFVSPAQLRFPVGGLRSISAPGSLMDWSAPKDTVPGRYVSS